MGAGPEQMLPDHHSLDILRVRVSRMFSMGWAPKRGTCPVIRPGVLQQTKETFIQALSFPYAKSRLIPFGI
ncbi:hypothetical protein TNCV_109051 [Trichonephila clavipes]|nr:hypothetical protein TNCV_109051 [Trichonephila clavipes]